MEIVNIEARTFEAMLSAFRTFADRLDILCRLYGDMEEKKWLDNQEVCLLLKVSPRTLPALSFIDSFTSPFQIHNSGKYSGHSLGRVPLLQAPQALLLSLYHQP